MKTTMKLGTAAVFMALAVGGAVAASAAPVPGVGQVRAESQVQQGASHGQQVTTRDQARVQEQVTTRDQARAQEQACVPSGSQVQVQTRTQARSAAQEIAMQTHRSSDGLSSSTTCTTCDPIQDRTQAKDGTGGGQLQDRDRVHR